MSRWSSSKPGDTTAVWNAILLSIPGIALAAAHTNVIEMPELGTLDGKKIAYLTGLAPVVRESRKWTENPA